MAYNPTNWECGDVVTAEKLNKLEEAVENLSLAIEGGGNEPLLVTMTQDGNKTMLDKTWTEIKAAFPNVKAHIDTVPMSGEISRDIVITEVKRTNTSSNVVYDVTVWNRSTPMLFSTTTEDGVLTHIGGLS